MYAEFDDGDYTRLRRSLVRKSAKGSIGQRKFLEAARDSGSFLRYMKDAVGLQQGVELEPLADRMSEAEFGNPPSDTERRLYEAWGTLTPRVACRTAFWARVTCRHIEEERIESSYLAANGGGNVTGTQRIDAALSATGEQAALELDRCVRTVLRRLGGLPEARGNRSVYVNCPLARAWWRERLVAEVATEYVRPPFHLLRRRERLVAEVATDESEGLARQIRAVVHPESQQYWEELVTFVVSRNSVFGSAAVRNMLIRTVAKVLDDDPGSPLRLSDELKRVCRAVSSIQASIELSVLPPDDVQTILWDIVDAVASQ